jgi:hypothetical protein
MSDIGLAVQRLEDVLELRSIACSLPLATLYRGVHPARPA